MKRTEENLTINAKSINARNKELSILIDSFVVGDEIRKPLILHNFELSMLIAFSNESKYSKVITFIEKYF